MSQEIDWGGIKIPIGDWEATPASLKAALQAMVQPLTERLESKDAENGQLKQCVAELEKHFITLIVVKTENPTHCVAI